MVKEYANKEALIEEIEKRAALFIQEFEDVAPSDVDLRIEGVDKTPREMIAYQLGWMELLESWEQDEKAGIEVVTPSAAYKWNQLGALYQSFYAAYRGQSLAQLRRMFQEAVERRVLWLQRFSHEELFVPGGRKWAQSTPSNWPVWKWVHINTVAPFQSFRTKIRKWKKLRAAM